jgi:hypothetical protein
MDRLTSMHRSCPLSSPPARTRTRKTHAHHSKSQPSANPAVLSSAYRKQNSAQTPLYALRYPPFTNLEPPPPTVGRRAWSCPSLRRAGRSLLENDPKPRVLLRKPRSGRMDPERLRRPRPRMERPVRACVPLRRLFVYNHLLL